MKGSIEMKIATDHNYEHATDSFGFKGMHAASRDTGQHISQGIFMSLLWQDLLREHLFEYTSSKRKS